MWVKGWNLLNLIYVHVYSNIQRYIVQEMMSVIANVIGCLIALIQCIDAIQIPLIVKDRLPLQTCQTNFFYMTWPEEGQTQILAHTQSISLTLSVCLGLFSANLQSFFTNHDSTQSQVKKIFGGKKIHSSFNTKTKKKKSKNENIVVVAAASVPLWLVFGWLKVLCARFDVSDSMGCCMTYQLFSSHETTVSADFRNIAHG